MKLEFKIGEQFSASNREEIIGVLWLIAALTAWNGEHNTIAFWLAFKSGLDQLSSIYCAVRDRRASK